ncbi:MAG: DUF1572 family protein [Bacteroidetes bacterium]|nr:DUF1572 family protein [Bacteroidota bacterium]
MAIKEALISELKRESESTKKMLERVPMDNSDWKPHEKSMSIGKLATHIAAIPLWISSIINMDDYDIAKHYKNVHASTQEELMKLFQDSLNDAIENLEKIEDADLFKTWIFRNGDHIIANAPKIGVMRSLSMSHLIHHRGQLSVYLRLLDVPVPGMYGPSADDQH